ncbi:three-Cys-motif partner protein TcmP [Bradyrhizobium sp. SZCCHNR2035]|uniref:three-Cys-motif partner protein TcmP n=1 Tax=Bradyrhizobium sp. SZCCHNR2035 TaxID=3057386 RepID=UPI0029166207|nr:three-Cys-motif partner protein TcmP [Bradyrhizobium sp. SZCCHNR2035]
MTDLYFDREQTKAKHFILRSYLQALAFKVLRYYSITYIDGFSGPWQTRTEDFSDSSFMIAISVLKEAQRTINFQTQRRSRVRCFFSESNPQAYRQLASAVAPYNTPQDGFEIETCCSEFEDAIPKIASTLGDTFPLIFIDPTGWTGYSFERVAPLFDRPKCEVLINFMYDFVNRAASMSDAKTVASLDPILGGSGWESRLDPTLPRGLAAEQLFRRTLSTTGKFPFVVSTKIDRSTADRPHFFIVYGTKSRDGLKEFREVEYNALRVNARDRAAAKERKRESRSGSPDLFAGLYANLQENTIDHIVEEQKELASEYLISALRDCRPRQFAAIWEIILRAYMLRVTNVKDICVELAKRGIIENTWGTGNRKPTDKSQIVLKTCSQ